MNRSFAWDKNIEPDIAGYYIYYKIGATGAPYDGTGADEGDSPIKIPLSSLNDPENPEYAIHGLSGIGTFYFAATAYDIYDNESGYSKELSYQISAPQPPASNTNIIDNGEPETSATGSWLLSNGESYYGTQSRYSRTVNGKYTYDAALNGSYDVYLRWTTWPSRCTAVPVEIYDGATLLDTVTVNHQVNGGQWNPIGISPYAFSGRAKVSIVSTAVSSCTTCADAVKFESSETTVNTLPVVEITAPATGSSFNASNSITFTGTAIDSEDGNISESLSWVSNLDGIIGSGAMFSTSALSEGTHKITASATDSGGLPCSATITVTVLSSSSTDDFDEATETVKNPEDVLNEDNTEITSIVIDNGDSGTSFTGTWYESGGAPPIGDDNLYSKTSGSTYTYQASINGYHEVYLHWTDWYNRCISAPIRIYDGTQLVGYETVNQRENGSRWNRIGLDGYNFSGTAKVVIEATSASCTTCADAVKFVSAESPELSYIEITGPSTVNENSSENYNCTAFYTDGSSHWVEPAIWSENSPYANISSTGRLTSDEVSSNKPCRISATYTENSVTRSDDFDITITDYFVPAEIIIDNDEPGTSYSRRPWGYSSGANPWGSNSLTKMAPDETYTFETSLDGYYKVYLWWTYWASRCTHSRIEIYNDNTLLDTIIVNQQENSSQWNRLDTEPYLFSDTAKVVVRSDSSSCSTCADAVRFVGSEAHK
ncbi:MAG: hypothetical protein JRE28_11805 [Deltaproteobacteria bacterium]|nr:hypothetical protein [Deltaproteobacteria bacterium]